jgi:beta-lactamase regulating signal transducer with metallopeptidase domain
VIDAIGWALLQFLWQGVFIAAGTMLALALLRRSSSNTRYLVACAGLLLMAAIPVYTFIAGLPAASRVNTTIAQEAARTPEAGTPSAIAAFVEPARATFDNWLPVAVSLWFAGVVALTLRGLLGWVWLQRLRHCGSAPELAVIETVQRLSQKLRLSRPVRVLESAVVSVPTAIGSLKPVILLPAATLTGLSPEQIEGILAHELAHIRRHDYLVNLFQTIVEHLLFYHPAVWYVSHRIRIERENCCDDLAVSVCGDRLVYVSALTELEQLRSSRTALAMQATGGSLLSRVRRQLGLPANDRREPAWIAVGAIVLMLALSISGRTAEGTTTLPEVPGQSVQSPSLSGEGHVSWSKNGQGFDLQYRGNVWLSDDERAITRLSPNGFITIAEKGKGSNRKLTMRGDQDGNIASLSFDGSEVAAKQFMDEMLPRIVRSGSVAVESRVERIYSQSGIDGALAEVANLPTDNTRRRFLTALFERTNPKGEYLGRLLGVAAGRISSNYELRQFLTLTGRAAISDSLASDGFFAAANEIESSYELRQLVTAIASHPLSDDDLATLLRVTSAMDSSYEKAELIITLSRERPISPRRKELLISVAQNIGSDYERGRALDALR